MHKERPKKNEGALQVEDCHQLTEVSFTSFCQLYKFYMSTLSPFELCVIQSYESLRDCFLSYPF